MALFDLDTQATSNQSSLAGLSGTTSTTPSAIISTPLDTTQMGTTETAKPLGRFNEQRYMDMGYNSEAANLLSYLRYKPNHLSGPQFNTTQDVQAYMQTPEWTDWWNKYQNRYYKNNAALENLDDFYQKKTGHTFGAQERMQNLLGSLMLSGVPLEDLQSAAMDSGYNGIFQGLTGLNSKITLPVQTSTTGGGLQLSDESGRLMGKDPGSGSYWTQNRSAFVDALGQLVGEFGGKAGGAADFGLGVWSDELEKEDKPYGETTRRTSLIARDIENQPKIRQQAQTQQQMISFLVNAAQSGKWNQIRPEFWAQYGDVFGGEPPTYEQIMQYAGRGGRSSNPYQNTGRGQ